eukprot:TRINITY_DN888_c0_g1_i3.p1 TRINITY_DN888_c0_g1~~TRINITY_DN888_c0_g1_i3.p1  ORF type:complete len:670 (-),score=122.70 TRINITY_DN888_c0_g1_i3:1427-3436(-)
MVVRSTQLVDQATLRDRRLLLAQFPSGQVDFTKYRTVLSLYGEKPSETGPQEIAVLSRTVYGFAAAFMLTGVPHYLEAAEKGSEYLLEHCSRQGPGDTMYWLHARVAQPGGWFVDHVESLDGEDTGTMPLYEQIYALAGPTLTFRLTGDRRIRDALYKTVDFFDKFYRDPDQGGYFSHVMPSNFSPHDEQLENLGHNKDRKNWNSIGDHAPAYLINAWLATGDMRFLEFLKRSFDDVCKHFVVDDGSPFVQERFFADWTPDYKWGWQQNRAVVGHNFKIAWNLMRMHSQDPYGTSLYRKTAQKIADDVAPFGLDQQRGGVYDVMERRTVGDEPFHRFSFHDRKAWWQQEQGILANYILYGCTHCDKYLKQAREITAFYNAFFLDIEAGAVYFNTLASGVPYLVGQERTKGNHAMGSYHSCELMFLGAVYTTLLVNKQDLTLYFAPKPGCYPDNKLRVAPDILPPKSVMLRGVTIDGADYKNFNAAELVVNLPDNYTRQMHVKCLLGPADVPPLHSCALRVPAAASAAFIPGRLHAPRRAHDDFPSGGYCQLRAASAASGLSGPCAALIPGQLNAPRHAHGGYRRTSIFVAIGPSAAYHRASVAIGPSAASAPSAALIPGRLRAPRRVHYGDVIKHGCLAMLRSFSSSAASLLSPGLLRKNRASKITGGS